MARHEDEPGSPETWQERIDSHRLALTRKQPVGGTYARFARPLREWLEARGIRIEHEELLKLLHQTIPAKLQADEHLLRLAQGDYRPDPEAARFPHTSRLCRRLP